MVGFSFLSKVWGSLDSRSHLSAFPTDRLSTPEGPKSRSCLILRALFLILGDWPSLDLSSKGPLFKEEDTWLQVEISSKLSGVAEHSSYFLEKKTNSASARGLSQEISRLPRHYWKAFKVKHDLPVHGEFNGKFVLGARRHRKVSIDNAQTVNRKACTSHPWT